MPDLLQPTPDGLYCAAGNFYVDPWRGVDRAVITHAHSDHARWGSKSYLAAKDSEHLLRMRLGNEARIETTDWGESRMIGGVRVTLHPAGHMLGSAQVRIEESGRVAVVTGDYKLGPDRTCRAWEPVRCHLLVTESTFALPIYRWQPQEAVFDQINAWWRQNAAGGKCSILYGYAIGKSQRLLSGLDPSIGPIYTHGAVERGVQAYRRSGIALPKTTHVGAAGDKKDWGGAIIVAVPSAHGTPWMRKFGAVSTAMASGWMAIRGTRRRRAMENGFVLSDHIDWNGFLSAVEQCAPEKVLITHGYATQSARFLRERGYDAQRIETQFRGSFEDEFESPDDQEASA